MDWSSIEWADHMLPFELAIGTIYRKQTTETLVTWIERKNIILIKAITVVIGHVNDNPSSIRFLLFYSILFGKFIVCKMSYSKSTRISFSFCRIFFNTVKNPIFMETNQDFLIISLWTCTQCFRPIRFCICCLFLFNCSTDWYYWWFKFTCLTCIWFIETTQKWMRSMRLFHRCSNGRERFLNLIELISFDYFHFFRRIKEM